MIYNFLSVFSNGENNMAEIYITLETVRDASAKLDNAQKEQESALANVQKVVDDVLANWEGKAKEAFLAAFDAKKATYKEFGIDMSSFSKFLTSYAQTMEDVDVGEVERISSI